LEIVSLNADDEDYEGHKFSISSKMSELRIVFLNRFIQEVHIPPSAVIPVLSVHKKRKIDFYRFYAAMLLMDEI
jgi:vacuolar protein sorting-associated protein 13A/C